MSTVAVAPPFAWRTGASVVPARFVAGCSLQPEMLRPAATALQRPALLDWTFRGGSLALGSLRPQRRLRMTVVTAATAGNDGTTGPGDLAVVTGAGTGIGRALCVLLVARGLRVIGVGRRDTELQQTADLAGGSSASMTTVVADISEASSREAVLNEVNKSLEAGGFLTCLVHNAATMGEVGPLNTITLESFRQTMATNVEGPLFLTQALAGTLGQAPRGGRVLNVGSGAAHVPLASWLPYCTSKAASLQNARCMDLELAPEVRVATANPGIVNTQMQAKLRDMDFPNAEYFRNLGANTKPTSWTGVPQAPPKDALDAPENAADFLAWLLLKVPAKKFGGQEWNIGDPECQQMWLTGRMEASARAV